MPTKPKKTTKSTMAATFSVSLNYIGQAHSLENVITTETTGKELYRLVSETLGLSPDEANLKLLVKGKRLVDDDSAAIPEVPAKGVPKILVMASPKTSVDELNAKKQDPTIRGFDQDKLTSSSSTKTQSNSYWGALSQPHKDYKFGRLRECPFHDFGHRPTDSTPHAFQARQYLQRLATDPGIIAILKERELVVGTLGEMDPIDDRLMQKKQQEGACLLGYNTNRGLRIDIKLRTDNLEGFRPYFQIVSTLIHELSHNWVGEHNALFWANYGQMRLEYFVAHQKLQHSLWKGKTSAALAEIPHNIFEGNKILEFVNQELQREMAQHHLHPTIIQEPLQQRYRELQAQLGQRLGRGVTMDAASNSNNNNRRNLALEAAERRAREQRNQEENNKK